MTLGRQTPPNHQGAIARKTAATTVLAQGEKVMAMSPNKLLIPLGLIIGVCSQAQSAKVYPDFGSVVQGSVYGSDCSSLSGCFLNLSQSTSVTGSTSGVNSSASALANLAQGVVSATAWASAQATTSTARKATP